jgi:hypothetical protein
MLAAGLAFVLGIAAHPARAEQKLKPEDLVARHLAAIGTDEARAADKARLSAGRTEMRATVGAALAYTGRAELVSEGHRLKIALSFNDPSYWGEEILADGERTEIGFAQPGHRSQLGGFLSRFEALVREGLIGGVLTTAWPLLDVAGRQPKLQAKGPQRVDGQQLQRLAYVARQGGGEVTIVLFFDPVSFRHVRTRYTYSRAQQIGLTIESSSQQREMSYTVDERFDDFKTVDGLTLPTRWWLNYTADTTNRTTNLEWETRIESVSHNPRIDASTFVLTRR